MSKFDCSIRAVSPARYNVLGEVELNPVSAITNAGQGCSYWEKIWAKAGQKDLIVRLKDGKVLSLPENYLPLWQAYVDMGLSSCGILNFQEQMIYYFPGKIVSPSGHPVPVPNVYDVWKDRRNVTNFKQAIDGMPRRFIRYEYRLVVSQLALDIRDLLMGLLPEPEDTIH